MDVGDRWGSQVVGGVEGEKSRTVGGVGLGGVEGDVRKL